MSSLFVYKNIRIGPYLNDYLKTEPLSTVANDKYKKDILITLHAEIKVVKEMKKRGLSSRIMEKGTLYVTGLSPSNMILTSKPCAGCMNLIKESGIKRVIYTQSSNDTLLIKLLNHEKPIFL